MLRLMSLYRRELSAVVLMVDSDPLHHLKQKTAFARMCEQSAELHFDSLESQLKAIELEVRKANKDRRERQADDPSTYSLYSRSRQASVEQGQSQVDGEMLDTGCLRPGDVYVTRHSNLSHAQVVYHMVCEPALASEDLSSRHPCVRGLHNIVRLASRAAIQTLSLPLLLVDQQCSRGDSSPSQSTQWCLARAELIFKCLKGFLMEVCSIGSTVSNSNNAITANGVNSYSATTHYNINFAVPAQLSAGQFHQLVELFTRIYHLVPSVSS